MPGPDDYTKEESDFAEARATAALDLLRHCRVTLFLHDTHDKMSTAEAVQRILDAVGEYNSAPKVKIDICAKCGAEYPNDPETTLITVTTATSPPMTAPAVRLSNSDKTRTL